MQPVRPSLLDDISAPRAAETEACGGACLVNRHRSVVPRYLLQDDDVDEDDDEDDEDDDKDDDDEGDEEDDEEDGDEEEEETWQVSPI